MPKTKNFRGEDTKDTKMPLEKKQNLEARNRSYADGQNLAMDHRRLQNKGQQKIKLLIALRYVALRWSREQHNIQPTKPEKTPCQEVKDWRKTESELTGCARRRCRSRSSSTTNFLARPALSLFIIIVFFVFRIKEIFAQRRQDGFASP